MIYEPILVNDRYVDNIDLFEKNKPGKEHVCVCRGRDWFSGRTAFMQHIKLKSHQKWVAGLSVPSTNPIIEEPTHTVPSSLKDEQDDEYERTLNEDRRKAQDNFAAIIRESEEIYRMEQEARAKEEDLERKRKSIVSEPGYMFRFIFPDGKKVSYTIHKSRPVSYMRDIVDVYMADHQNIYSYELFMFPNRVLDTIHTIEEAGIENRSTIYVRSL
jgi:hypothetical protein